MLSLKRGVRTNYTTQMLLGILIVKSIYDKYGYDCRITSGMEAQHAVKSLHYIGNAADFGIRGIPSQKIISLVKIINSALGDDYYAAFKRNHIHVQYRPGQITADYKNGLPIKKARSYPKQQSFYSSAEKQKKPRSWERGSLAGLNLIVVIAAGYYGLTDEQMKDVLLEAGVAYTAITQFLIMFITRIKNNTGRGLTSNIVNIMRG